MNRTSPAGLTVHRLFPFLLLALSLALPTLSQEPSANDPAGSEGVAAPAATMDPSSGSIPESEEEAAQVQAITDSTRFSAGNESKDPFKPLVKRPEPVKHQETRRDVIPPPDPPKVKPITPLVINVAGICGNESERLAMILFENKPYVVHKEMNVDGKFKVVDVLDDRLIVFSFKEQIRRTFPIGGGKE